MEETKQEIKIYIETSEKENTTTQNLWDSVKAVLRGKFIAICCFKVATIVPHVVEMRKLTQRC